MESVGMRSLENFYRDKRVLVTGHTGFKGGWLVTWLKLMGAEVTGLALPPDNDEQSFFAAAQVAQGMNSIFGDIRDRETVAGVFRRHRPQIVIHGAAQALVRASYADPVGTYETNLMGTLRVLEAVREIDSVRAVILVTSDKCYENREWLWAYRESDALGGHDPYSSSKACVEIAASAYRRSFFSKTDSPGVATVRAGNVIGGGDWAYDRIVPDIARSIAANVPIVIRHPDATRPWQHVLEPLRGYLMLAQRLYAERTFAEAWNFGPLQDGISVYELAKMFVARFGKGALCLDCDGDAFHEASSLRVDNSKAVTVLGWRPFLPIEDAVALTADWYLGYIRNRHDAAKITQEQVEYYNSCTGERQIAVGSSL